MKKLYLLPLLFLAITGFAQKQFIVQNGTAQTFSDINAAITAASAGDTIYLPGGGFSLSPTTIEKTLHWRGVGHYPDSTIATGHTQITNAVSFTGNCDNSTFEGIYFQSTVAFGSNDDECTGVSMKRCRIGSTLYLRSTTTFSGNNPDLNFRLSESVVAAIDARFGTNVRVEKSLIFGGLVQFYQCYFNHNSINSSSTSIQNCDNCLFLNNVFSYNCGIDGNSSGCNFQNNLFQQTGMPYNSTTSTHTGSGNITTIGTANVYTNIVTTYNYQFDYANDYRLKNGTTGTAEDGTTGISIHGTSPDNTDAGIYGTSLPYKEGAVPYAPHVQSTNIDNEAVSGNLGVQINVAAQDQ